MSANDIQNNGNAHSAGDKLAADLANAAGENVLNAAAAEAEPELFVSGLVYPGGGGEKVVEIHRGMTILTTEGEVAGMVAGVIYQRGPQAVKYILLSRPSRQIEYRMVPVELIQQVNAETVSLQILAVLVNTLPTWR